MERHIFIVRNIPERVRGKVEFTYGKGGSSLEISMGGRKDLEMELRRYLTKPLTFIVPAKVPEGATCGMKEIRAKPISSAYSFCSAMSMLPGQLGLGWRLISHTSESVGTRNHKG